MIIEKCLICALTWLLTVLHSRRSYASRVWVSGGTDRMNLDEIQALIIIIIMMSCEMILTRCYTLIVWGPPVG